VEPRRPALAAPGAPKAAVAVQSAAVAPQTVAAAAEGDRGPVIQIANEHYISRISAEHYSIE
jgi:hypothetical protein